MPLEVIDAEALFGAPRPEESFWPTKPEQQDRRLRPMCLPTISPSFRIGREDLIFTIGSCFARNVEKQLLVEGYNVASARFAELCAREGVNVRDDVLNKFSCGSIAQELRWALDPQATFDERSIVDFGNDQFLDLQLAPVMRPAPADRVRALRRAVNDYMALAREAKVVIVTLGLAETWVDAASGLVLNRPPLKSAKQLYPGRYKLHVLDYQDIVAALEDVVATLKTHGRPDVRLILTVSPVAMGMTWTNRDALIANCYSKSVQRAAAAFLESRYDFVDYLPSYESITLSDRRIAWREDAAHVADEAVRMNVLRMMAAYTGEEGSLEDEQKRAVALQFVRDSQVALREKRHDEALKNARLAKEIAPDEVAADFQLGATLLAMRDLGAAKAALRDAYDRGGLAYGAADQLGLAHFLSGEIEAAIPLLEEAVALNLKGSQAARHLADAYWRQGRRDEAIRLLLETAIPRTEKSAPFDYHAAMFLREVGRLEEASALIDRALHQVADNPKYAALKEKIDRELQAAAPAR